MTDIILVQKMLSHAALVFSALLAAAWSAEDLSFPPGFKFGVASASYQVEGAWNVSDKGESIWDQFCHRTPSPIADASSGDVACDSYHRWKEDVEMVAKLGVQFYRISIAWTRILPTGFTEYISEDGKKYYGNLIDGLLEKGIEPVVTLYHWDLPQRLQNLGGLTNPLIADWFADYARVVYSLYGDRVKTWITINEPWVTCDVPYFMGTFAPGILSREGAYMCSKNVLMAHAKAWRVYDEEFRSKYHGKVSLVNHLIWMEAANEDEEPTAELLRQYLAGRFSHPIYSEEGGWPPAVEKVIADNSKKEGYARSILAALTQEEIQFMKGTFDFYALNFYSSRLIRRAKEGEELKPWPGADSPNFNAKVEFHPDWPTTVQHFPIHPEGIRKQLVWLKKQYGDLPFIIMENGRGTYGGLDDQDRIEYYRDYMEQVLLAIKEDGVNVTGYTAWTLMDNFEWKDGYNIKFGLYEVDFSSPLRTRTPRVSAEYYASVVRSHSLDVPYNLTVNVDTKSSKTQDSTTSYVIFGGLVMVIVVVATTAIVTWAVKRRARLEKKHRYAAVKAGRNIHNGDQNGTENGEQNGQDQNLVRERNGGETRVPLTNSS